MHHQREADGRTLVSAFELGYCCPVWWAMTESDDVDVREDYDHLTTEMRGWAGSLGVRLHASSRSLEEVVEHYYLQIGSAALRDLFNLGVTLARLHVLMSALQVHPEMPEMVTVRQGVHTHGATIRNLLAKYGLESVAAGLPDVSLFGEGKSGWSAWSGDVFRSEVVRELEMRYAA